MAGNWGSRILSVTLNAVNEQLSRLLIIIIALFLYSLVSVTIAQTIGLNSAFVFFGLPVALVGFVILLVAQNSGNGLTDRKRQDWIGNGSDLGRDETSYQIEADLVRLAKLPPEISLFKRAGMIAFRDRIYEMVCIEGILATENSLHRYNKKDDAKIIHNDIKSLLGLSDNIILTQKSGLIILRERVAHILSIRGEKTDYFFTNRTFTRNETKAPETAASYTKKELKYLREYAAKYGYFDLERVTAISEENDQIKNKTPRSIMGQIKKLGLEYRKRD